MPGSIKPNRLKLKGIVREAITSDIPKSGAQLGNVEEYGEVVTGASGQHKEMP